MGKNSARQRVLDSGILRLVLLYALVAGAWIFLSDSLVSYLYVGKPYDELQTLKGLLFVTVTALFLYRLVRGYRRSLEEHARAYQGLFGDNPNPMLLIDPADLSIVEANPSARRFYGRDRLKERRLTDLSSSGDDSTILERELPHADRAKRVTVRHVLGDGSLHDVELVASPIRLYGRNLLHLVVTDVTAQAEKEARYRRLHSLLWSFLDNIPCPLYIVDLQGRFSLVNPYWESIVGRRFADVLGQPMSSVFGPESAQKLLAHNREVAGTRRPERREETLLLQGRLITFDTVKFPVLNESGEVEAIGGFSVDITERKRVERDLVQARQAAEAASQAKSQFLANMSHELRTPLNGIMGMIELLLAAEPTPRERKYLELARESSRELLVLVNDLLDLSSLERKRFELLRRPFDLTEAVDSVARFFSVRARLKGVDFSASIDPTLAGGVMGDELRLKQVLINLLDNAVKFTERGSVSLDVRLAEDAIPMAEGENALPVAVTIRDTGIGIPQDRLREIFLGFTLAEDYLTKRYGGAGLGLAIANHIVASMGGRIEAESVLDQGSLFRVMVPLARAPEQEAETPAKPVDMGPAVQATVLQAEDEATNRLMVRHLLEREGMRVLEAGDGQEALELLARERVDLVLMDIQMPRMDGLEAVRRIRDGQAGEGVRDVPVVAVTAYAAEEDRTRVMAAGMTGFLTKPFGREELLLAVREALAER